MSIGIFWKDGAKISKSYQMKVLNALLRPHQLPLKDGYGVHNGRWTTKAMSTSKAFNIWENYQHDILQLPLYPPSVAGNGSDSASETPIFDFPFILILYV